jgi:hypothetical protein
MANRKLRGRKQARSPPVVSADVAVQQKAKKGEPDGILRQLFSTEPVV